VLRQHRKSRFNIIGTNHFDPDNSNKEKHTRPSHTAEQNDRLAGALRGQLDLKEMNSLFENEEGRNSCIAAELIARQRYEKSMMKWQPSSASIVVKRLLSEFIY
jgi:hypothetical protein